MAKALDCDILLPQSNIRQASMLINELFVLVVQRVELLRRNKVVPCESAMLSYLSSTASRATASIGELCWPAHTNLDT